MKCDKCKKNEANFHKVSNINGKVTEVHLCSECAKESNEFNMDKEFEMFNSKRGFLNDIISDFNQTFSYFTSPMLNNFLDYNDFADDDFFSVKRNNFNKIENKNENKLVQEEREKLSELDKKKLEIQKLDLELKKAVVEERYEDAVVLRDKIKKLKEEK